MEYFKGIFFSIDFFEISIFTYRINKNCCFLSYLAFYFILNSKKVGFLKGCSIFLALPPRQTFRFFYWVNPKKFLKCLKSFF